MRCMFSISFVALHPKFDERLFMYLGQTCGHVHHLEAASPIDKLVTKQLQARAYGWHTRKCDNT